MDKTAFIFSGQGAQCPGMMKEICEAVPESMDIMHLADNTLKRGISELCFQGEPSELNLTHNTQPCVLAADLAAYQAVLSKGIRPDAVAGFSLGEYAALAAAEVMALRDAFQVIQARADAMQAAVPAGQGAMAAVSKLSEEELWKLCVKVDGYVAPANYNCPGQIVIAGESKAVEQAVALAREANIKAMLLPVSAPFHCELMEPAAAELGEILETVEWNKPIYPVYMNVDATVKTDQTGIKDQLVRQAKSPVLWEKTLRNMYKDGVTTFIELGPGKTLTGFVRKTFQGMEGVRGFHVSDMESLFTAVQYMEGS